MKMSPAFAFAAGLAMAWSQTAAASDVLKVGKAQLDPATTKTLSVVLPTRDGDHNRNGRVRIHFRKAGTAAWKESVPAFRHGRGKGRNRPFAGMLFGLTPATDYEIKLVAEDADGVEGQAEQILEARTRAVPPVVEAEATNRVFVSNTDELKTALRNAVAGQLILLDKGVYPGKFSVKRKNGTADKPIVIRGAKRNEAVLSGSLAIIDSTHIQVEDLTIRTSGYGLRIKGTCENITIRGNMLLAVDKGIDARQGHRHLYIVRNVLIGNNVPGDTSKATWNDEGIVVTGQGIEVAHNTLAGFGDALGMSHNTNLPNRGIDIHHNKVLWSGDDGIEMDFTDRNGQAHHNLITNSANGLSCQMVWHGPAFLFRNVMYNMQRGPYKIKPERTHNEGIFIFNNTSIKQGRAYTNFSGRAGDVTFLNNLFCGAGNPKDVVRADSSRYRKLVMDHNAWNYDGRWQIGKHFARNFRQWQAKSGQGRHDLLLEGEKIFEHVELDFAERGFRVYRNPNRNFSLARDSRAIDAAKVIPGINDDFIGNAPDIGAWEFGETPPRYGALQDETPPTAPPTLKAEPLSTTSIRLTWSAAKDGESGIAFYRVYRDGKFLSTAVGAAEFTDHGLDEAADYSYAVSALNGAIRESGRSPTIETRTLTDTTRPAVKSVEATGATGTRVAVAFSEPLEKASAETAYNYSVNGGIKVMAAKRQKDRKTVILTTSAMAEGHQYALSIRGVKDQAKMPNAVAATTVRAFQFVKRDLIVDFGPRSGSDTYGLEGFGTTIRDRYTRHTDGGPGGMTVHAGNSSASYNFQGVKSDKPYAFNKGDQVIVTWYNNSSRALSFTPKLSLDDPDRPARKGGTWQKMSAVSLAPGETGTSTYSLPAAGSFSVVNVNDNIRYGRAKSLVCDKIELKRAK